MEVSGQVQDFTLRWRRDSPGFPLDRRLGGPQSRSGQHEGKHLLALPGTESLFLCYPVHSPHLYRRSCPGSTMSLTETVLSFPLHGHLIYIQIHVYTLFLKPLNCRVINTEMSSICLPLAPTFSPTSAAWQNH
jgi:hypothetical protein